MKVKKFFDDPDWPLVVLLSPLLIVIVICELDSIVKWIWNADFKKEWKQYRCKHEKYSTKYEQDPDAFTWYTETCSDCGYTQITRRAHYRKALVKGIFGG